MFVFYVYFIYFTLNYVCFFFFHIKILYVFFCIQFTAEWLLTLAPQYYDLNNFPQCAAKRQLELLQQRLESKQYQKGF